jgi:hypothetical protein
LHEQNKKFIGGEKMKKIQKLKSYHRAKQISIFEAWHMKKMGIRDGKLGLPRKDDDTGKWTSPQIRKEFDAYNEFTENTWLACEELTASLHVSSEKLYQELECIKTRFQDFSADHKYQGEDGIDSSIIRARRVKEQSPLEEASKRLNEIRARIAEIENLTRLNCQKIKCHFSGRIASYWCGLLMANINTESIPPAPPELHASGEDTYMSQHRWSSYSKALAYRQMREDEDNA